MPRIFCGNFSGISGRRKMAAETSYRIKHTNPNEKREVRIG